MASLDLLKTRLDVLEKQVSSLKAENELLKSVLPLSAITEALRSASDKEKLIWCKTVQDVLAEHVPESAPAKSAKGEKKSKRAATNPEGPKEWNAFVRSVQKELMAARGAEDVDALSEEDLKKESKKLGLTRQECMREAGIRKRMMENGLGREEAIEALGKKKTPVKKTPAKKEVKKPVKKIATFEQDLEDAGFTIREVDGERYAVAEDGEAFTLDQEEESLGNRVGIYDADSDVIDTDA